MFSYAIYLIHDIAIHTVVRNAPELAANPFALGLIVLAASLVFAAAIETFVDPAFRRLRDLYRGPRETSPALAASGA